MPCCPHPSGNARPAWGSHGCSTLNASCCVFKPSTSFQENHVEALQSLFCPVAQVQPHTGLQTLCFRQRAGAVFRFLGSWCTWSSKLKLVIEHRERSDEGISQVLETLQELTCEPSCSSRLFSWANACEVKPRDPIVKIALFLSTKYI